MKKLTACTLVLALLFSLSACGGPTVSDVVDAFKDEVAKTASSEAVSTAAAEETAEDSSAVSENTPAEAADSAAPDEATEEIVLAETDAFSMKITGIELDGTWGYTWNVLLENKTDCTLMFSIDDVAVDGMMCDPFWASTVSAGMKSKEEISWYDLADYGIEKPTIITGTLHVYDDDTYEDYYNDSFTVTPYGEEAVTQVTREAQDADISLLETEEYTVTLTRIYTNDYGEYAWTLYIENNSQHNINITLDDVSLDGVMCDPFWADNVSAGMSASSEVSWYEDLTEYGISDPSVIEGTLEIYDSDSYDDYYSGNIRVTPQGEDKVQYILRDAQETDQVLLDNDYLTVTYTSLVTDDYGDTIMNLYIENKTDSTVMVSLEDCSVNGFMCDPYWADTIAGGKVNYGQITWGKEAMTNIEVTAPEDITDISFTLTAYNYDSYEDYAQESVSVTP